MAKKSENFKKFKKFKESLYERVRRLPQHFKMKSALSPLVENLKDESSEAYLFVKKNAETVNTSFRHGTEMQFLVWDLLRIRSRETISPQTCSLLDLYCYLAMVESAATNYVDIVLLLLIAAGHDLHIERRFVRHVSCFEDLAKVGLWTKLEFLKDHDLKPVCRIFDRDLRNRIAHLDFTIDPDGMVKTGKGARIDIIKKTESLIENLLASSFALQDLGFHKILDKMVEARKEESKK